MLELFDKETLDKTIIYDIKQDSNGYPKFLIRKDNQWIWRSAKFYITDEEYKNIHRVELMSFDEAVRRISGNAKALKSKF